MRFLARKVKKKIKEKRENDKCVTKHNEILVFRVQR